MKGAEWPGTQAAAEGSPCLSSRSLGIDRLVPYIFGLVHDSQRLDEGTDPEHGLRAAAFVRARREDLFGFLPGAAVDALAVACDRHSDGETVGEPWVRPSWDADRLDIGRVNIVPDPDYLCTDYARRPSSLTRKGRRSASPACGRPGATRSASGSSASPC